MATLAALAFLNTLSLDFVLDDVPLVRDHAGLERRSVAAWIDLWREPYWPDAQGGAAAGLYRPATVTSLAMNRSWGGPGPFGFHATNVALHAIVAALAWYVLRGASVHYGTALLGASLFALHPLHVEAVAPITGRAELLSALFVLAAWLAHRTAARASSAWRWVTPAALYLLAITSKEGAFLAPLVFLLEEAVRGQRQLRQLVGAAIHYGVAAVLAFGLRAAALGGLHAPETTAFLDNPAAFAGSAARVATALWVQVRYALLVVFPWPLSSDYSSDAIPLITSAADWRLWAGVAGALGLAVGFALTVRRSMPVAIGICLWCAAFLPSSNLLFATGTLMAERLAYLPSLGACLIAAHLAAASVKLPGAGRRFRIALLVVVWAGLLVAAAVGTTTRNRVWRDNATLALNDVQVVPRSAKLQAGAGIVHQAQGRLAEAEAAYLRALEIYPDYAQVRFNLGGLLVRAGRREAAVPHLTRAGELSPHRPEPFRLLASLHEAAGRTDEALAAYAAGAAADPTDLAFRFNHARALLAAGRLDAAREQLASLQRDDPLGLPGSVATALHDELIGHTAAAIERYQELLERSDLPPAIRANLRLRLAGLSGPSTPGGTRHDPEAR